MCGYIIHDIVPFIMKSVEVALHIARLQFGSLQCHQVYPFIVFDIYDVFGHIQIVHVLFKVISQHSIRVMYRIPENTAE